MELKAYVTNLGKYNEGELVGKWITLPIDEDDYAEVLKEIGIGTDTRGRIYEEVFFTDYDCEIPTIYDALGEYESINTLNEIGEALSGVSDSDEEKCKAVLECHVSGLNTIADIINSLDDYEFIDVNNEEDLGYYIVDERYGGPEELGKETLERYFDYEAFGRDAAINDYFETEYGYVSNR